MKNQQPDEPNITVERGPPPASIDHPLTPLKLNPDDYRDDLAGFDLSEEQQNELLQTLWDIMSMFVDMGWGVDNIQVMLPELFDDVAKNSSRDSSDLLESKGINKKGQRHE